MKIFIKLFLALAIFILTFHIDVFYKNNEKLTESKIEAIPELISPEISSLEGVFKIEFIRKNIYNLLKTDYLIKDLEYKTLGIFHFDFAQFKINFQPPNFEFKSIKVKKADKSLRFFNGLNIDFSKMWEYKRSLKKAQNIDFSGLIKEKENIKIFVYIHDDLKILNPQDSIGKYKILKVFKDGLLLLDVKNWEVLLCE